MVIASVAAGLGLSVGGAYLVIDNLIEPQGYLYEGLVLAGLGVSILLLVTVAISIGKTILMFIEIMQKQIEVQQQLKKINTPSPGTSFTDMIKSMIPPGNSSMIISDPASLSNMMKPFKGSDNLSEMGLEQLEKELAKAVKKDDFERAEEINKAIKKLKSLGGPEDPEEKNEE